MRAQANQIAPGESGWRAAIGLRFENRAGRCVLAGNEHAGPLTVQKPFYPEGADLCHVYLVHPPGGICGGDELAVSVEAEALALALATTPAAGKFYRSAGPRASLRQHFTAGEQASLEWLPQETIVYDGARALLSTRVELARGARFLGWEIVCLGLAASNKPFESGAFEQCLDIVREGRPVFSERLRCLGGDHGLSAAFGLGGHTVAGTFVCAGCPDSALAEARAALAANAGDSLAAASAFDDLVVCRFLGGDSALAKKAFVAAWEAVRPYVLSRPASRPRIWAT